MLQTILMNPLFKAGLAGLVSAAAVDFHAFHAWKNFSDAKTYDWNTALFRWVVGFVSGVVTGAGYWLVS